MPAGKHSWVARHLLGLLGYDLETTGGVVSLVVSTDVTFGTPSGPFRHAGATTSSPSTWQLTVVGLQAEGKDVVLVFADEELVGWARARTWAADNLRRDPLGTLPQVRELTLSSDLGDLPDSLAALDPSPLSRP